MQSIILFLETSHQLTQGGILGAMGTVIGVVFLFILITLFVFYGKLWFQGYMSGAQVSLLSLFGMSLRKVNAQEIVKGKIMLKQAGLPISGKNGITTRRLESHYLAGGDVSRVIRAMIAAHRADLNLNFDQAAAIDLAGRDVLEAVQTSVNPKVIVCPDPHKSSKTTLSAITKNGVELRVRAQVTVRTNLEQLIGGATEDTIIARVGEGIITAIGSAQTHLEVLENPVRISRKVLERGLDSQTAFQIVSIDIADIDVGANIGARLQVDQAKTDLRVAEAQAEKMRAEALAIEQEMRAKVAENRAKVVEAESLIPQSMSAAFREGRFS